MLVCRYIHGAILCHLQVPTIGRASEHHAIGIFSQANKGFSVTLNLREF